MRFILVLFNLVSLLFFEKVFCGDIRYEIRDLGTLQSEKSRAVAINKTGQVAGYYTWKGVTYPYFWDPDEGLIAIDVPEGQNYNIACLPAQDGRILGWMQDTKSKKPIDMVQWDRNSGLHPQNIRFNAGCELKEVLGVISDYKLIGIQESNSGEKSYFISNSSSPSGTIASNLSCIHGDLGVLATISSVVGCAHWQDNSGHTIAVANCLYPIVHKGEIVGHTEKAMYWMSDTGWKAKQIFSNNGYAFSRALAVNNNGEVICETEEGWKLVNLKTNKTRGMRSYNPIKSFNGKGYFLTDDMDLVETTIENGMIGKLHLNFCDPEVIVNLNNGFWKRVCAVNAINDAGYVIGEAETEYGEVHAILLIPLK